MEDRMMGREKNLVGRRGENIALHFLKRKGYKILGTNVRTPLGEIDLVAKHRDIIVFVEVKTRSTSSFGPPYLAITWEKKRKLIQNALCYLKKRRLIYSDWRIDVVSININYEGETENIELIENAVEEN
jgi:putative endonuclease